jgi:hypothetical protein
MSLDLSACGVSIASQGISRLLNTAGERTVASLSLFGDAALARIIESTQNPTYVPLWLSLGNRKRETPFQFSFTLSAIASLEGTTGVVTAYTNPLGHSGGPSKNGEILFRQQGVAGYTNLPIRGIRTPACTFFIYREGELVGTVNRNSNAVRFANGQTTVSGGFDAAVTSSPNYQSDYEIEDVGVDVIVAYRAEWKNASVGTIYTEKNNFAIPGFNEERAPYGELGYGDTRPNGRIRASQDNRFAGGSYSIDLYLTGGAIDVFDDVTAQDGSYLIVARYGANCLPPWYAEKTQGGTNQTGAGGFRYSFFSFVVDTIRPVAVFRQWDDFIEGFPPPQAIVALGNIPAYGSELIYRPDFFGGAEAPTLTGNVPTVKDFSGNRDTGIDVSGLAPGNYTVAAASGQVFDKARNAPLISPNIEFTVHALPESLQAGANGAKGIFSYAGPEDEIFPVFSAPVSLLLTFDKPVIGITKRNFSLSGYTADSLTPVDQSVGFSDLPAENCESPRPAPTRQSPVGIVDIVRRDEQTLAITLNADMQLPNMLWKIVFTPDANVFVRSEQMTQWKYEFIKPANSVDCQPPVNEEEKWSILFNDEWYLAKIRDGQWKREVDDGESIRYEDISIPTPQRCILSSRFAWVSEQPQSWHRDVIDTSSSGGASVNACSITDEVEVDRSASKTPVSEIATIESAVLPASVGDFFPCNGAAPYVPQMPPDQDAAASVPYSYFGLSTTIYPATPARVSACAAPSEEQRHSSAVFSADNISSITATLELKPVLGYATLNSANVITTVGPNTAINPSEKLPWGLFNYCAFLYRAGPSFPLVPYQDDDMPVALAYVSDAVYQRPGGTGQRFADFTLPYSDPIQFMSSVDGLPFCQNRYVAAATEPTRLGGVLGCVRGTASLAQDSGESGSFSVSRDSWSIVLSRELTTYPGIMTSAAGPLAITISGKVVVSGSATRPKLVRGNDFIWREDGEETSSVGVSIPYSATMTLTPEEEQLLATGQSIVLPSGIMCRRSTREEDFGPITTNRNWHFWRIQAS